MVNPNHYRVVMAEWALPAALAFEHFLEGMEYPCLVATTTLEMTMQELIEVAEIHESNCELSSYG